MNNVFTDSLEKDLNNIEKFLNENDGKNIGYDNIFKIFKIDDFEIRHSNFLRWLFDLKNNFNVASLFIERFFKEINVNIPLNLADNDIEVAREEDHIDLIIKFNNSKFIVIIENKIYSTESDGQLTRYYSQIEKREDLIGFNKLYLYLTLSGEEPILEFDKKHWKPVSYVAIKNILKHILKNDSKNLKDKCKIILQDYLEILKEKTEDNVDKIEYYHKLYKQHKTLLTDMISYIPQINERAKFQKEYINANPIFKLNSKNANTYIYFSNMEIDNVLKQYNVPNKFIEFVFSNEPYDKLLFGIIISKSNNLYKPFVRDFKVAFNLKLNNEKNGDYVYFYSKTLLSLKNKNDSYKTELEFQELSKIVIKDYFEDKDSEYFKIVDFIKNYNFKSEEK